MKKNKTISSQIVSGVLKFLIAVIIILVVIVIIIPSILSLVKGKDIPPVDDSNLPIQTINIPEEENAFYDLNYDLHANKDLINKENIPEGKKLVTDYLEADSWNQELVEQIIIDNEKVLEDWTIAASKDKFQLPYTNEHSKISRDMTVPPLNIYREISRLSGVKAIWLAEEGEYQEALDEALKSIIIGNNIENSQAPLIAHLVGIAIKDNGLDVLQKLISIIPEDFEVSNEYQLELEKQEAEKNASPFIIEYIVWKQALDNSEFVNNPYLSNLEKLLMKNSFYYKENLTLSYYYDFYAKIVIESKKDCDEINKVEWPVDRFENDNIFKMYFTENLVGKYYAYFPEDAFNSVLKKRCATENKLQEIILMIDNRK
ncbi:hypothetical protein K9M50_03475 [Patescibacteria group bacterium]|nr:hypothetical protein [Patescibacteria group bacterium]